MGKNLNEAKKNNSYDSAHIIGLYLESKTLEKYNNIIIMSYFRRLYGVN
jgi:hypothetical protein